MGRTRAAAAEHAMRLILCTEVLHDDPWNDVAHVVRVGELGERHARHQSLPRHRAFMRISSGHDMPPSAQVVTVDTRLSYLVQGTPR